MSNSFWTPDAGQESLIFSNESWLSPLLAEANSCPRSRDPEGQEKSRDGRQFKLVEGTNPDLTKDTGCGFKQELWLEAYDIQSKHTSL